MKKKSPKNIKKNCQKNSSIEFVKKVHQNICQNKFVNTIPKRNLSKRFFKKSLKLKKTSVVTFVKEPQRSSASKISTCMAESWFLEALLFQHADGKLKNCDVYDYYRVREEEEMLPYKTFSTDHFIEVH